MYFTVKRLRLFLGALIVLQIGTCLGCLPLMRSRHFDFRSFYTAGYMVRSGDAAHLYDYELQRHAQDAVVGANANALPFMSPPFTALLFVPLSRLGFVASHLVFFVLNLMFAGLAIALVSPYLGALSARWRAFPALLFLSFLPLGIALSFGQLSILLLLLYCACFAALQRDKPFVAGMLLSIALIKLQIALPVALLFLLWRRWRFIAGFSVGSLLLAAISLALAGPKALRAYPETLFSMSSKSASSAAAQLRFGILPAQMPNLFGLFHSISGGAHWGFLLTIAASVLVLAWAACQRPSLPLALLAALLVSYHLYLYDLTILLLPISLLINRQFAFAGARASDSTGAPSFAHQRRIAAVWAGALLLLAPAVRLVISSNQVWVLAIPIFLLFLGFDDGVEDERTRAARGVPETFVHPAESRLPALPGRT